MDFLSVQTDEAKRGMAAGGLSAARDAGVPRRAKRARPGCAHGTRAASRRCGRPMRWCIDPCMAGWAAGRRISAGGGTAYGELLVNEPFAEIEAMAARSVRPEAEGSNTKRSLATGTRVRGRESSRVPFPGTRRTGALQRDALKRDASAGDCKRPGAGPRLIPGEAMRRDRSLSPVLAMRSPGRVQ
jgi:hypothetical protein